VIGGLAVPIAGLVSGWLVFGGTAESRAQARADTAVVQALVPICVAQYGAEVATAAKIAEFKALSPYQRTDFVMKAGWATMPGGDDKPNAALASACSLVVAAAMDKATAASTAAAAEAN